MISFNIEYEKALDFEHCDQLHTARAKLSELTNLLNRIISVRQQAKKDILAECASYKGEKMHKLSWENKMIRMSELCGNSQLMSLWQDADEAYKKVKNKQSQVLEDLMALKKVADITPR